ncbi:MAG TPA: RhuM family protein [Leptospiraceae bacterium]|nr:RhuM family protein [Leptospiraceae bacterium]HMW04710.1 RhuM family protein [Leptospiraceae bacterium]HMX31741.1 RhuM family protein [Leptospiraceae bacterium]HMY30547.1 RhuM family protein [Leptospiraceae bacterium]HMZ64152.1 RhuM family protein [Leptospiraceae bacterium]
MTNSPHNSEILIYQNPEGKIKIDVRLEDETVWLTQAQICELFQKSKSTISEHIKNIFEEEELDEKLVVRNFRTTSRHGAIPEKKQEIEVKGYNLDVIISVGYRVKSTQGTKFRIWATQRLKDHIIKGFTLNEDRFKSGNSMNYFSELQERIREIRLSERFFYQKIKDIYTTSIDYDPKDEKTIEFFKVVQNKLLWAISSQTAAELIYKRVDANLPLLGMQSFDKKSNVSIKKSDVGIAKNFLNEDEIKLLGLLVEQYLAFAEAMAQQKIPMYMKDWISRLDSILQLNGRELLTHAGRISHEMAIQRSQEEFEKYKQAEREKQKEDSLKELEEDIQKLNKKSIQNESKGK